MGAARRLPTKNLKDKDASWHRNLPTRNLRLPKPIFCVSAATATKVHTADLGAQRGEGPLSARCCRLCRLQHRQNWAL